MSLNKGIQGFKARIMGVRTASATPDSLGYNDGCPVDNKIHFTPLVPGFYVLLGGHRSELHSLVSKSFI